MLKVARPPGVAHCLVCRFSSVSNASLIKAETPNPRTDIDTVASNGVADKEVLVNLNSAPCTQEKRRNSERVRFSSNIGNRSERHSFIKVEVVDVCPDLSVYISAASINGSVATLESDLLFLVERNIPSDPSVDPTIPIWYE